MLCTTKKREERRNIRNQSHENNNNNNNTCSHVKPKWYGSVLHDAQKTARHSRHEKRNSLLWISASLLNGLPSGPSSFWLMSCGFAERRSKGLLHLGQVTRFGFELMVSLIKAASYFSESAPRSSLISRGVYLAPHCWQAAFVGVLFVQSERR